MHVKAPRLGEETYTGRGTGPAVANVAVFLDFPPEATGGDAVPGTPFSPPEDWSEDSKDGYQHLLLLRLIVAIAVFLVTVLSCLCIGRHGRPELVRLQGRRGRHVVVDDKVQYR